MIDELNAAIKNYQLKWDTLLASCHDGDVIKSMVPTAVAWKATDMDDFDRRFAALRDASSQMHMAWVNERWLATFFLRDKLAWNITVVKLMQMRPGSTDVPGLDHIDFRTSENVNAEIIKGCEPGLTATDEQNGEHCKWTSLWFEKTEAKIRSDTTWDVCIAEMKNAAKNIGSL